MADLCEDLVAARQDASASRTLHALGNQLGVVLGLLEMLLEDTPATDPRQRDLQDARQAASDAAATLSTLQSSHARSLIPVASGGPDGERGLSSSQGESSRQVGHDERAHGAEPRGEAARTVLVVDDQPQLLRTMRRFLGSRGYDVETATSVEDAVTVLGQRHVDAVVMDVRMPMRSGLELLMYMREDERLRDLPAVVLTGAALSREEQAIVARCKAYVFYKPKSYEHLTNYLDRVTRRPLTL